MAGMRSWSFRRTLVFWWILFLVIQQAERLFLLPDAVALERPAIGIVLKTLMTGFRADFIVSTIAIICAAAMAGIVGLILTWLRGMSRRGRPYHVVLTISSGFVSLLILIVLTADMGYYHHNHQHLDFVFFEYLDDLLGQPGMGGAQAGQQTAAELADTLAWALRLVGFLLVESLAIMMWWFGFKYTVEPALSRHVPRSAYTSTAVLVVGLLLAGFGFHPRGPYAIRTVGIQSAVYYTLAQNPILYGVDAWRASRESHPTAKHALIVDAPPLDEAVRIAQEVLGKGERFLDPRYPFVREVRATSGVRFEAPANVLLIFVEGLDRRYLGRTIAPKNTGEVIQLTPFLDRLKGDSVYFENFFANGVQTSRGLFASFCSYYPSQGASAMKTRYANDYLCLPALLRNAGYRTEMIISQHHDINRLQLFMVRNGLDQLFDEDDFPKDAEKVGPQITDGALLTRFRTHLETLQTSGRPFFLTTLTFSTHHPFGVPMTHKDVRALREEEDGYIPALRYFDVEFEQFFLGLQRDGLLKNTVVFILGDHGRHEMKGKTQPERQLGHFMSPLFVWLDPSLRTPANYRPRVVSTVASQVDLAPTILALNGVAPHVSALLGHDLSCVLVRDCGEDNVAYLSSVYSDVIALADKAGVLVYSLPSGELYETDLALRTPAVERAAGDPAVSARYRRLLALYISSSMLLERNQIWSWKEWGKRL
jgi:hypothetical protein